MITIEWLKNCFGRFNQLYFDDSLPEPHFKLTNTKSALGTYRAKRVCHPKHNSHTLHIISISLYYERSLKEYANTLLHEMIHYYINYHKIKDTSTHGVVFRSIMEQLNNKHGWSLSVSTKAALKPSTANNHKQYVVLSMQTKEMKHIVAVVNPKYVGQLNAQASKSPYIMVHHWYVSTDSYFDRFPAVRTLKGFKITPEEWTKVQALTKLIK